MLAYKVKTDYNHVSVNVEKRDEYVNKHIIKDVLKNKTQRIPKMLLRFVNGLSPYVVSYDMKCKILDRMKYNTCKSHKVMIQYLKECFRELNYCHLLTLLEE